MKLSENINNHCLKFDQEKEEQDLDDKRIWAVRELLYNISVRIILQVINEKRKRKYGTESNNILSG